MGKEGAETGMLLLAVVTATMLAINTHTLRGVALQNSCSTVLQQLPYSTA